jgi:hypothetical protein
MIHPITALIALLVPWTMYRQGFCFEYAGGKFLVYVPPPTPNPTINIVVEVQPVTSTAAPVVPQGDGQ